MKFIINSIQFSKQIQSLSGVLTNSNTIPIINCFHFHLDEDMLTIRATDMETTLVTKMAVESGPVSGLTDIAVPSKLLLDVVKSLDDMPLTFNVDDNTYGIVITSGDGKYHLAGKNAETFPSMPEATETSLITMTSTSLIYAIGKTAFAASTDEVRPQMTGIFCDLKNDCATFVATDAHKLVRYRNKTVHTDNEVSFILPRKPVTMLRNILSICRDDAEVNIEYNKTNVYFTFENFYIICRLIDGQYPNYDAAIPKDNPNKLTIDRASFLNTLRRVGLFANQASHQIRLSISERELNVSTEDHETSNNANEKLPCQYDGEPMEIGFNAKFLTEMVNNIETEQMLMELSHPSRAGIIFPVKEDEDESEDILMLVMPVMLNN